MHPVVIAGRQVDGGEAAIGKLGRPFGIGTQQFESAVVVAFGLEYSPAVDGSQLADGAIGGTHDVGLTDGPGTRY